MKNLNSFLGFLFLIFLCKIAVCQDTTIVFNGQSLTPFYGQDVQFNQTLYVVDRAIYTNYTYLYLSYERLRQAEEVAIEGTPAFDSVELKNSTAVITARINVADFDATSVRLGATISNLTARVTGDHNIRLDELPTFACNTRPTQRPDVGDARLVVCASNLEYYCPYWQGTYGAGSDEEFDIQHIKTVKALLNIDADIYALTELQQGAVSLDTLVYAMNAATAVGRYAHVEDYDSVTCQYIKVGFIYRTDKVRPVKHLGHVVMPSNNLNVTRYSDYRRMEVQCFEEIATGERMVVCMNHFKSKSGGDSSNNYYNANRVLEAHQLLQFIQNEIDNDYYEDADFLILGDLNCATLEEPVRTIEDADFVNLLSHYAPQEYSYSFNRTVEYLDHALASPSMAEQVTGAAPYHLNADESYLLHYDYSDDTTMYRYSDHDPIIVGVTLSSASADTCRDLHFFESFQESFGCFEPVNLLGNSVWYGYSAYECAAISGNSTGANTDWLVSPTFDLTNKRDAELKFTHTMGYGSSDTWGYYCKLLISKDFTGDISSATWAQLSIDSMPAYSWQWRDNAVRIPDSYAGRPAVTLAFKYEVFAGSDLPTWEIKNVEFSAVCSQTSGTEVVEPCEAEDVRVRIWVSDGQIRVESAAPTSVEVYDVMGRQLFREEATVEASVTVLVSGIYVVKCGEIVRKVVVKK